jgi:hypothetical protein
MSEAKHLNTVLNASTPVLLNTVSTTIHPVTKATINNWGYMDLLVQNIDASATVYIGSSTVTSSSYGYKLAPGATLQLDNISTGIQLYAISSGASNVAVLQLLKP